MLCFIFISIEFKHFITTPFKCKNKVFCITECKEGWYGDNCNKQCVGHCKDGTTCNHMTGQCDRGCDAGWTGAMCGKGSTKNTFTL